MNWPRTLVSLLLLALAALCTWLVLTSSNGLEFALSLAVLCGFSVAAAWMAARRAT